jgi:Metal-dependent amidase/aminoacylase/carboxypeptidase
MGGEIDFILIKVILLLLIMMNLNKSVKNAASEFLGSENVEETELRMGAEDFGYYAQQIPLAFTGWVL